MLENSYYTILSERRENYATTFVLALLPDCAVYAGHFPDNPIAPGVCNMQMLKELAERVTGKSLLLHHIAQCRLLEVITPAKHPQLTATITLTPTNEFYNLEATITAEERVCLTLRGTLRAS